MQAERESFNIYPVLSCFIPAVRTMPKTANGARKKVWRQLRTVYSETKGISRHEAV